MEKIAQSTGSNVENGILILPETLGKGYMRGIQLGPFMGMMIHQYELAVDVTGRRSAESSGRDVITFSFRNVFLQQNDGSDKRHDTGQTGKLLPSVQVSSGDIDLDMFFPAQSKINTIIVNIHVDLLKDLINRKEGNPLLQTIILGTKPYLYEEVISPEIQDAATKIVTADASNELLDFYYKLKAEELIYLFLIELVKRKDIGNYPFNIADVKKIYAIRDKIIADLTTPPNIPALAQYSGMSVSKMERLFKQIFGNTIYNYHQKLRISEAAYLIENGSLSVSEVGYQLGFTNLSHFARLFERQMGITPKKYSVLK